jgi:D-lactate dehydrogenase (cytochrome)
VHHRIRARAAGDAAMPRLETDASVLDSFLSDAAHVPGGFAAGVAFPRSEREISRMVQQSARVLAIGAQSSLTGGATPRGEVVLSTRALTAVGAPTAGTVRVGAGVPLATLQRVLASRGLYFPPVPTYDGAFVGGAIATNAAGAATFKYGSMRPWVAGLTLVLASGDVLDVVRGAVTASPAGYIDIEASSGAVARIPVPTYRMPPVAKLSAGYYAAPGVDLIDLLIGSEGTLGVIVEATLRVIPRPRRAVALVRCDGDAQALAVTAELRAAARAAREREGPLDVSAIEYMDARALRATRDDAFARAGVPRPPAGTVMLLVQFEVEDEGAAVDRLAAIVERCGVGDDPAIVPADDPRGAQRMFDLREAVPAGVNALVAAAKASADPRIEKTAGDMVVPFERLGESIALYRRAFERRDLDYAIWGHVSDGNLHPNVVPRSWADVERGREAILEIGRGVMALGGAPLAEHGVGRSALKQQLLRELYGDDGIEQMRAVKRALDPSWKLAPGVLFPPQARFGFQPER